MKCILCAVTICAFIHRLAGAASALQIACVEQPHGAICAAITSRETRLNPQIVAAQSITCPFCHAPMRIIAFINDSDSVRQILNHIGESTVPPKIAPARGPQLWEPWLDFGLAENDPQWDSFSPA